MRSFRTLLILSFMLSAEALAHGPTPQKIEEKIEIKASPKAVWAIAGDFAGIAKWDSVLKASEGSNKKRVLTFGNGEKLEEDVDEYDSEKMTYSYRMSDPNLKAVPASSYSATLTVTLAKDGGSLVEWYARAYRGDTGNEPPEGLTDQDVKDALGKLFKTGLEGIKSKAEKG